TAPDEVLPDNPAGTASREARIRAGSNSGHIPEWRATATKVSVAERLRGEQREAFKPLKADRTSRPRRTSTAASRAADSTAERVASADTASAAVASADTASAAVTASAEAVTASEAAAFMAGAAAFTVAAAAMAAAATGKAESLL